MPAGETVYWRAQARLALDEAERRRRDSLAPLRHFQRALGIGTVATGAIASLWLLTGPADAALIIASLLLMLSAVGASLVAESAS